MRYYFAPLEGITDSIYRQLHHQFFPGVHQYYTPFLSPTIHRCLTPKEQREVPPADSLSYRLVPQLLTKNPDDFLWMAGQCADRGYTEVNLNLGCPSGTVTAKGKGSGMLRDLESLNRFLDAIYSAAPVDISVKTRIGFASADEFPALLDIFNQHPIKELTIHPRVRGAFYDGNVEMEVFQFALRNSRAPLCYNGDIKSLKQAESLPPVDAIMIGRGLVADPSMLAENNADMKQLEVFYDAMLEAYSAAFGSSRNALFRLKEHWRYFLERLEGAETLGKKLRKTTDLEEYRHITKSIFTQCQLKKNRRP